MTVRNILLTIFLAATLFTRTSAAYGQSTEEKFQDLFLTAGYAAGFGAALGAAFLAFHDNPEDHLRYVAVGASLGFIGGTAIGTYLIFTPSLVMNENQSVPGLADTYRLPAGGIVIRPTYSIRENRIAQIEGGMALLQF